MIKYLVKKKIQKEAEQKGKRILIYTGAIMTGVGIYFSYKAIQNHREKKYIDELNYLSFDEYDEGIEELEKDENEIEEMAKKINSKRLNSENDIDIPKEEIIKYSDLAKDSKDDVEINEDDYKKEPYEEYEYIEDELNRE